MSGNLDELRESHLRAVSVTVDKSKVRWRRWSLPETRKPAISGTLRKPRCGYRCYVVLERHVVKHLP